MTAAVPSVGRRVKPWLVLAVLGTGFLLVSLDGTAVAVATPTLQSDFGVGISAAIWVTTAYLLAYVAPMLVAGRLGDRWGRRRIYLAGLTVFTLASLACAAASTVDVLITARIVQGLGAALMAPQALAIVADTMPPHRLGLALGVWSATAGAATVFGPVLGGVLVSGPGWRWVFLLNVPLGLAVFVGTLLVVPPFPGRPIRIAFAPALLSTAAFTLIVIGLQELTAVPWAWCVLVAGGILLMAFLLVERRGGTLMPPKTLQAPGYLPGIAGIAAAGFSVTVVPLVLMLWAQEVDGVGPAVAGLLMVPLGLLAAVLAPFAGVLIDRFGPRIIALSAVLLSAVGMLVLAMGMLTQVALAIALIASVFLGVANAAVWASLSVMSFGSLPERDKAPGAALYNTVRQLGAVVGSAIVGLILPWQVALRTDAAGTDSVSYGIAAATVLVIAALAPVLAAVYLASAGPQRAGAWRSSVISDSRKDTQ